MAVWYPVPVFVQRLVRMWCESAWIPGSRNLILFSFIILNTMCMYYLCSLKPFLYKSMRVRIILFNNVQYALTLFTQQKGVIYSVTLYVYIVNTSITYHSSWQYNKYSAYFMVAFVCKYTNYIYSMINYLGNFHFINQVQHHPIWNDKHIFRHTSVVTLYELK